MSRSGTSPCGGADRVCGCCEGTEIRTPASSYNRPGLDALRFRVGRHGDFLATMKARLSSRDHMALAGLRTRDERDVSIALLDGWATVGDVLAFYQERIANEGYLRTATERRSVLELARLVGYAPRPGVAATVYLAYTLDDGREVVIPAGSGARSVPGPGEQPQGFETAEELKASAELNSLGLRMTKPQHLRSDPLPDALTVAGRADLKTGDALLLHFRSYRDHRLVIVRDVVVDSTGHTTQIVLSAPAATSGVPHSGLVARVHAVAERVRTPSAMGFPVPGASSELALLDLVARLTDPVEMVDTLHGQVLPGLETAHADAVASGASRKAPWLARVVAELRSALDVSGDGPSPLSALVGALRRPASIPPASRLRLDRDVAGLYAESSDLIPKLYGALVPRVRSSAYAAMAGTPSTRPAPLDEIEAMRVRAGLFGHNIAALRIDERGRPVHEPRTITRTWQDLGIPLESAEELHALALDAVYDKIKAGSWVAIRRPLVERDISIEHEPDRVVGWKTVFREVASVATRSLSSFGVATSVSVLTFDEGWLEPGDDDDGLLASELILRSTTVWAAGEAMTLAHEPIDGVANDVTGGTDGYLELDGLYRGLEPGRWIIVAGERTDTELLVAQGKLPAGLDYDSRWELEQALDEDARATGVHDAELAMIAEVAHGFLAPGGEFVPPDAAFAALPGDTLHTFVRLAVPLAHRYQRRSVVIHGNVVRATHGETRREVLGAGDATRAFQAFALKQPPLTYLPAPTAEGADSTLEIFVNDARWREADHFVGLHRNDPRFVIRTDDGGAASVVFGNGVTGARLPTGRENVHAVYRSGIGAAGNVAAKTVTLLAAKPLGVKEVVNPLPGSGGADRESRDQARSNAPRPLLALDRLVSVQDYADFARAYAGIAKAAAAELSDGRGQLVHVTIAGANDMEIAETSDLYRNLLRALHALGDPHLRLALEARTLRLLVIEARIRVLEDRRWETVEPALRAALLDALGFERRELGQPLARSEVLSVMHAVPGVAWVDVDTFGALGTDELASGDPAGGLGLADRIRVRLARRDPAADVIQPAELLVLSPDVPDTLILSELP